jgi:hypothetical protein
MLNSIFYFVVNQTSHAYPSNKCNIKMSSVEFRWNHTDKRIPELIEGKSYLNATLS